MNKAKGTALLLYTEKVGPVGGVRGLINSGSKLVFENLNDVVEDAIRDGDVLVDPGNMLDSWDFDGREVVVAEPTLLFLSPREAEFVDLKDVLQ